MNSGTQISVVAPVYNEEEVVGEFYRRLTTAVAGAPFEVEILFVNDGSRDRTLDVLRELVDRDSRVRVIDLSRNFGKEIAVTAGLDRSEGDAVVVIDSDLQDPPELIPRFVEIWQSGEADVIYGKRMSRRGETLIKRATSFLFYRSLQRMTRIEVPADVGDFRLLSRDVVDALRKLREQHRYMKGLFSWVGYRQVALPYRRDERHAGTTKWNYFKLWNLAVEGFTSFTVVPLKLASYLGLMVALLAFAQAIRVFYRALLHGDPVAGYPSLMVTVLFLSGVQLIALGVIGEYLGRIFNETKNRPLYFIRSELSARSTKHGAARQAPAGASAGRDQ